MELALWNRKGIIQVVYGVVGEFYNQSFNIMKIKYFIILLFIAGCAHTPKWDAWDKVLFGSFAVATVADIKTTNDVLDDGGYEKNPALNGNEDAIIPLNIVALIGVYYLADYLKPKNRKWALGIANLLKWGVVAHNLSEAK